MFSPKRFCLWCCMCSSCGLWQKLHSCRVGVLVLQPEDLWAATRQFKTYLGRQSSWSHASRANFPTGFPPQPPFLDHRLLTPQETHLSLVPRNQNFQSACSPKQGISCQPNVAASVESLRRRSGHPGGLWEQSESDGALDDSKSRQWVWLGRKAIS